MQQSCDKLGLDHYIREEPDTGNWNTNTKKKPAYIRKALEELKRPVLWIDVDGSILERPELLKSGYEYDFAARRMPPHRARTWHVGTMYFAYTPTAIGLLDAWIAEAEKNSGPTDEAILDKILRDNINYTELNEDLKIGELPAPYFEMLRHLTHAPSKGTIICHRASQSDSKMRMKKRLAEAEKAEKNKRR
jgi:hypothetical protein